LAVLLITEYNKLKINGMPRLGKDDSHITTLSDASPAGESPCDLVETQETETQGILPGSAGEWWQKAKESGWLPWAVAAGFGILWLRKDKKEKK
jgi:hypothetical protein